MRTQAPPDGAGFLPLAAPANPRMFIFLGWPRRRVAGGYSV